MYTDEWKLSPATLTTLFGKGAFIGIGAYYKDTFISDVCLIEISVGVR